MGDQTFALATFNDFEMNRGPDGYAAAVDWGDGQSGPASVTGVGGAYAVGGDHAYQHPGNYAVTVSVTDPAGVTATTTEAVAVAGAALTATGGFVDGALANQPATLTVATFADANGYDAAGSYATTINWGDGATSAGVVTEAGGLYTVSGTHTYQSDSTYAITTTITDADGTTARATRKATSGDLYAGVTHVVTVSSFGPVYANEPASDFRATVDWGDGSGPARAMVTQSGGVFSVAAARPLPRRACTPSRRR